MSGNDFNQPASAQDVFERRRLQLLQQRNEVQESSLQSTRNALTMIAESEQVGIKTAEELLVQREKLEKVDQDLDEIGGGLRQTQKNLNAMKGFFNGVRSLWRGPGRTQKELKKSQEQTKMSTSKSSNQIENKSELAASLNKLRSNSTQYEGLKRNSSAPSETINFDDEPANVDNLNSKSSAMEAQLDNNLADLQIGLGRLKNLAIGLGNEITDQNEYLDKITGKSERIDDTIKFQNKLMCKQLKK